MQNKHLAVEFLSSLKVFPIDIIKDCTKMCSPSVVIFMLLPANVPSACSSQYCFTIRNAFDDFG